MVLSATSISVSASLATLPAGTAETLAATVTTASGTPSGGTVTFLEDGSPIGTANLANG